MLTIFKIMSILGLNGGYMINKAIFVKCSEEYKKGVEDMAKSRGMNVSEFVRFLIEKQKEADRK